MLALLVATPTALKRLSRALTPAQWAQPLGAGERSFTEVVAHLLHSEARFTESIHLALLCDGPQIAAVHSEREFGALVRYAELPGTDLLAYFQLRRTMLLRVLTKLADAQWARTLREAGKQRQESVYWRARAMALHEAAHVVEIQRQTT